MARGSSQPVLDSHGNRVKNLSFRETTEGRVYERTIYIGGNPKRRRIDARTVADAIRQLRKLEAKEGAMKVNRGGRALTSLTIDQAAQRYFKMTAAFIDRNEVEGVPDDYKGLKSRDTLATYQANYDNWIQPFFRKGQLSCMDATTAYCQEFFAHLRRQPGRTGKTLAEGTVNSVKSALSAILEEARVAGAMDFDPLAGLPKRDRPKTKPRASYRKIAVRPEVLFAIYDNAPKGYKRALVAIAVFTGMRAGEIVALKWEDVHLGAEHPYVWIGHAIARRVKGQPAIRKTTKTGRERPFPLNPETVEALETHREKERERGLGRDGDYIFTNPNRSEWFGEPVGARVALDTLRDATEGLRLVDGKGEAITALDLRAVRRSVATHLANNPEIPRHVSAGQMGHSVETSDREYVQKHHDASEIAMVGLAMERPKLKLVSGGKEASA